MKNEIEDFDRLISEVVKENEEPKLGEQFTIKMMSRVYEYEHKTRYRWLFVLFPILLLAFATAIYYAVGQDWFFALIEKYENLFTLKQSVLIVGGTFIYLLYSRILIGILVLKRQLAF